MSDIQRQSLLLWMEKMEPNMAKHSWESHCLSQENLQ